MSGLEIPERALQVACDVYDAELIRDDGPDRECAETLAVRAAAPIIVAAELRRQADRLSATADSASSKNRYMGLYDAGGYLRDRANELDSEWNTA